MGTSRRILLSLLVAIAMLFAACGDDDAAVGSGDDTSDEGPSSDGGDADGGDSDEEQAAEDAIGAQIGGECSFLGEIAGGGIEDAIDPSAMFTTGGAMDFGSFFQPIAEEFAEVAAAAPGEIKAEFTLMAEAFSAIAAEMAGLTIDFSDPENIDPEAFAQLEALGERFDGAEFEAAADKIETWIADNCDTPLG